MAPFLFSNDFSPISKLLISIQGPYIGKNAYTLERGGILDSLKKAYFTKNAMETPFFIAFKGHMICLSVGTGSWGPMYCIV